MNQRRRKADKCLMVRLMDRIEPYDRISLVVMAAGALTFAVSWYNGMNAVAKDTTSNSTEIDQLKRGQDELRFNMKNLMNHFQLQYVGNE